MSMEQILATIRQFDGVLELAPATGSEFPAIAWGDHFFYYAPDGTVPSNRQPYATIVTKNYPCDTASRLGVDGRWRLNIHVGMETFSDLVGESPRSFTPRDSSETDVILPHPVYGGLGWIAIVNPGARTTPVALELLRQAHDADRRRVKRRTGPHTSAAGRDAENTRQERMKQ